MPNMLTRDEAIVGDLKVLTGGQVQKSIVSAVARVPGGGAAVAIGTIPAGAVIFGISIAYTAVSNAGTSASVGIGTTTAATELVNNFDVHGNAAGQYVPSDAQGLQAGALGTVGANPLTIYAKYNETGTASTAGGPFVVAIEFVTPTS